jgi:hypothetical protein
MTSAGGLNYGPRGQGCPRGPCLIRLSAPEDGSQTARAFASLPDFESVDNGLKQVLVNRRKRKFALAHREMSGGLRTPKKILSPSHFLPCGCSIVEKTGTTPAY